jgi:hypothetical protein
VQQSDPLGPLLFCLVMRHVSLGVANIFSSTNTPGMALNASYLDDGLFGHNLGTLTRVLEYLQSPVVQSLGLYLNIEKSSIYQKNHLSIPHMLPADHSFERGQSTASNYCVLQSAFSNAAQVCWRGQLPRSVKLTTY